MERAVAPVAKKRVALVGCLDDEASKAQLLRLDLTCEAEPVGARLTREAAALLATAHRVSAVRAELARTADTRCLSLIHI